MNYQPTHLNQLPKSGILKKSTGDHPCDPYVFDQHIAIAVDVALATGRPLLVSGNPGCGKSRLADAVAAVQGWNLLSRTITSRTRLESLTAEVDQLRRLNDAQARSPDQDMRPDQCYLNPGILWWAFQPHSARLRGLSKADAEKHQVALPYPGIERDPGPHPTVLLLDEIDKAEPDLPNDLLEPLDRRRFTLPDGFLVGNRTDINAHGDGDSTPPTLLTIITTNRERELPPAFLRRCVQLELPDPSEQTLIAIGRQHFAAKAGSANHQRIKAIAGLIERFRKPAEDGRLRLPGTAEFLDAVRACEQLNIDIDDRDNSVWRQLERAVLDKDGALRRALGQ